MSPSRWQVVVSRISVALRCRRRPTRPLLVALATAFALTVPAAGASADPAAPDVIYSSANNGTGFATIDPATGAGTLLGASGFSSDWAATVDTDGTLWTIINGFGSAQIATVDKTTGHATPVGSPIGTRMISLEISSNGTMYGMGYSDRRLYTIDKTTGVGTAVGSATPITNTMDLAFDCSGRLWATTMGMLWTVDTATGVATDGPAITGVAEGASSVMGLMFDSSCHMLATTYTSPGALYSVDALGAATLIGSTSLSYPHGGDIVADTQAPTSSDDVPSAYQNTPVTVTLLATDAGGSGVDHTYYTVGATPADPTSASAQYDPANKPVLSDGQKIRYFSTDLAGNIEAARTSGAARVAGPVAVAAPPTRDVPCSSRRAFTIHVLTRYQGHAVRAVGATINGREAKVEHRNHRFTVRVDMRGRARVTVTVRLYVRLAGARAIAMRRAFHPCQQGT